MNAKTLTKILLCSLVIVLDACGIRSTSSNLPEGGTLEISPSIQAVETEKPEQPPTAIESSFHNTYTPEASEETTAELEITFVAARQIGPPGIFAIRLSCPDENPPCIGDAHLLFTHRLLSDLTELSWSPTGDQVVFSSHEDYPGPNLYISSTDGSELHNLTETLPKGMFPSWSPDGSQIAYTSCQQQPCKILSIDLEDSTMNLLLDQSSTYGGIGAVWSGDSSLLAFNAYPDDNLDTMQIFVSRSDGSDLIQVTDADTDSYLPWISPDGRKVVYMGTFGLSSGQKLFISDLQGNQRILITNPQGSLSDPAWSPINGWIVFKQYTEVGGLDLFIVREDGTHLYQLTNTPDISEGSPAWRLVLL